MQLFSKLISQSINSLPTSSFLPSFSSFLSPSLPLFFFFPPPHFPLFSRTLFHIKYRNTAQSILLQCPFQRIIWLIHYWHLREWCQYDMEVELVYSGISQHLQIVAVGYKTDWTLSLNACSPFTAHPAFWFSLTTHCILEVFILCASQFSFTLPFFSIIQLFLISPSGKLSLLLF